MRIIKKFRISEVTASLSTNAPLRLLLTDGQLGEKSKGELVLDAKTLKRFSIPIALKKLMGMSIEVSLMAVTLPLIDRHSTSGFDYGALLVDDLMVRGLVCHQTTEIRHSFLPPIKTVSVSRVVELETHTFGGFVSIMPCPYYHFHIDLLEDAYELCRLLPVSTIFRLSLSLI